MPAGQDSAGSQFVNTIGKLPTYNATVVAQTPVASATEPFFTIQGSATATIYVTSIDFSMKDATGSTTEADIILFRYSAMNGGTAATALTASLNDTHNPAATATVQYWTTLNTSVTANGGAAAAIIYPNFTTAAAVVSPMPYTFLFGTNSQAFVLRGTGDWLGLCISAIGTTPLVDISATWIESTGNI